MELTIRNATVEDIPLIQHMASLTWPEAYYDILTPGQLQYMQHFMYSQQVLKDQMLQQQHQFYIAENGRPVGFAGVSPYHYQRDNDPNATYWKLHKLYVLPYVQKTGAGKALMATVTEAAKKSGAQFLLLNVNRNNMAYDFYLRLGFSVVETGDFDIGAGFYMNDYVMCKSL